MGALITTADFDSGRAKISQNTKNVAYLDEIIDLYEQEYLYRIMGVDMTTAFLADLSNKVPQTAKYQTIYNAFHKSINNCYYRSFGMKEMLKSFIYTHFVGLQSSTNTPMGNVSQQAEVSEKIDSQMIASILWNEACRTADAIQQFIRDNPDDYPDFDGETIPLSSAI